MTWATRVVLGLLVAGSVVVVGCADDATPQQREGIGEDDAMQADAGADGAADAADCDRSCLLGILDGYIDALARSDSAALPLASRVHATENAVETPIGEGLWKSSFAIGSYRQSFADAEQGQAGLLALITTNGAPAFLTLRLRVEARQITESEALVTREGDSGFFAPQNLTMTDPVFDEVLPAEQRLPREELVAIVDRYFDGIVKNDAAGLEFDPLCERFENGVVTATIANLATQFANFSYIKGIDRRYAVVDEERGLVWGIFSFQIPGDAMRPPRTTFIGELFKIVDGGRIRAIQAFLRNTPYGTPSGWP